MFPQNVCQILIYSILVQFLYFMKTRQATSNPKFVRKCSHSPWEATASTCISELNCNQENKSDNSNIITPTKNVYTISQKDEHTPLIRKSQAHLIKVDGLGIRIGGELINSNESKVQQCKNSQYVENEHQSHVNSWIYLPIQNSRGLQSLPTIRKKATVTSEQGLQTKRKESVSYKNQEIQKLLQQNKSLLQEQQAKDKKIESLHAEISNIKIHNKKLEEQVNYLRCTVSEMEAKADNFRRSCDQMRGQLEDFEVFRIKQEDKINELVFNVRKLQLEIIGKKQQIQQLTAIIQKTSNPHTKNIQVYQNQQMGHIQKARIYTVNNGQKQPSSSSTSSSSSSTSYKCNRYIQTSNCKLEQSLKQNENLINVLKCRDKTIKNMQKDIYHLNKKVQVLDEVQEKQQQMQKMVEILNMQIMGAAASKLATKYKYF